MKELLVLLALAATVASCDRADDAAPAGDNAGAGADTLRLVATENGDSVAVRAFDSPAQFPLRFRTYIPATMVAKLLPADADDGAALQFAFTRGATDSDDAFVHVFVYPPGTTTSRAETLAQSFLISQGVPGGSGVDEPPPEGPPPLPAYEWPLLQEDFASRGPDGRWREGVLLLSSHGDRMFHVVVHYLASDRTQVLPLAQLILRHWRWTDSGTMLMMSRDTAR